MSINFRGIKSLATFDSTNSNKIKSNTINTSNIISNNIQTSTYTSSAVNTVLNTSVVYDGTFTVNANGSHTYILVFDIINNSSETRNFTIDADINSAQINDRVVLMFKVTDYGNEVNSVTCNLSDDFFYTKCGDKVSSFNIAKFERMVIEFFYDGEKYVNTYDNC
jgi:hypothetical protein